MGAEVSFFSLGVEDAERGRAFYQGLFGWSFGARERGGGFAITSEGVAGGIHGGDAGASPYVFFRVDDIAAAAARVRELGGSVDDADVEGDEESAARFGLFRLCRDDQGSSFGLHQPPPAA